MKFVLIKSVALFIGTSISLCAMDHDHFDVGDHVREQENNIQLSTLGGWLRKHAEDNNIPGMQETMNLINSSTPVQTPAAAKQLKLYSALYRAILYGNFEAAQYLLNLKRINLKSNPNHLLHILCFGKWHEDEKCTLQIIEQVLAAGADINQLNHNHKTPLSVTNEISHYDSSDTSASIKEFLKSRGAHA